MCKGPEAGVRLVCSRNGQEVWPEQVRMGERGRRGYQEETGWKGVESGTALWAIVNTLPLTLREVLFGREVL